MVRIINKRPDPLKPEIPNGVRGYGSAADRRRAITMLAKQGCNYFVTYRDVRSRYALTFGFATWVAEGRISVQ